jgi:hypothetical protein
VARGYVSTIPPSPNLPGINLQHLPSLLKPENSSFLCVWQGWHLDPSKMHKPPLQKGDVVLRVDQCPVTLYNVGPKLREGPVGSLVEVTLTILS